MEALIDLGRGPLFRIALAVLVLGLAYQLLSTLAGVAAAWSRAGDRRLPSGAIGRAFLSWIFPARLLRAEPLLSVSSFVFHIGLIVVPLTLAGHVEPLRAYLPAGWPTIGATLADGLTLLSIAGLIGVIVARTSTGAARGLTRAGDLGVLAALLVTLGAGFLAAHPALIPGSSRAMMLVHVLAGNLVLVLIPTTKIAHCIVYPFAQLVSELGWHYPAASGRNVKLALGKQGEGI